MRRMRSIMSALAANTAGYAALQAQAAGTPLTLAATQLPNPTAGQLHNSSAPVTLTSAGNLSAGTFTVVGRDRHGQLQTEIITGPNANTVSGHLLFTTVISITPNTTSATTVSAGWAGVNYGPWLITAWHSVSGVVTFPSGTPNYSLIVTDFNLLDATYFQAAQGGGGTPVNDLNSGNGYFAPTDAPYIDIPNTPYPLVPAALQASCPQLLGTNQCLPEDDGTYSQAIIAPSTFTADAAGVAAAATKVRLDPVVAFAWRLQVNSGAGLVELDLAPQRRAY